MDSKDMNNSLANKVTVAVSDTQRLYLSDDLPWVVGYSGGKDSTATLQLIWSAIEALSLEQRTKPIYVISTDTLVENPVVAIWVRNSLSAMRDAAVAKALPFEPNPLKPSLEDRYWVNLIGRGYPAPRPMFRWCTSRLKINASTKFITEVADKHGEAILVLGSRKAESIARDRVLTRYENSTRELLSRNSDASLDRVWVYTPIASWSTDDVWEYLMNYDNPWGYDNQQLFEMYRGATPDAECPLVVDKDTPSCGDSRFGCFVCTMVTEDKSMKAMIQNDEEKQWMQPLLQFRNECLKTEGDRHRREFTRIGGRLTLQYYDATKSGVPTPNREVTTDIEKNGKSQRKTVKATLVHGPYSQCCREDILRALLETQRKVADLAPDSVGKFELISHEELEEIRRIWVHDKHEFEDSLPRIFEEVMQPQKYPSPELDEAIPFRAEDILLLKEACGVDNVYVGSESERLHFELLRELLHIQHGYRGATRRVGLVGDLTKAMEQGSFQSEEDALNYAIKRQVASHENAFFQDPYIKEVMHEENPTLKGVPT